jgi:hypothetical protein
MVYLVLVVVIFNFESFDVAVFRVVVVFDVVVVSALVMLHLIVFDTIV